MHSLMLLVVASHFSCVGAAWGHAKVTETFDEEVSANFVTSTKISYAKRRAVKLGRPLLVLLTKRGCGACQNLKQSVNHGKEARALLGDFVVVHAENAAMAEWQAPGQGYAPQTYFYAPGEDAPLPIQGTSEGSPHFFHDEPTLVWGMRKALAVVASGERSNTPKQEL